MDSEKDWISEGFEILYSGKGLQALSELGHRVLKNPVLIHDTSFRQLAYTVTPAVLSSNLLVDVEKGWINPEIIEHLNVTHTFMELEKTSYPVIVPPHPRNPDNGKYGTMSCSVRIRGTVAAYVSVAGTEKPFSQEDKDNLVELCKMVSIELQKDSSFLQSRGFQYEHLLQLLITGELTDPNIIAERLILLEKPLKENIFIMLIRAAAPSGSKKYLDVIKQERLREFFSNVISANYNGNIVLLISCGADEKILSGSRLTRFLETVEVYDLNAGLSAPVTDISRIKEAYDQALAACSLGTRFMPERRLFAYRDIASYDAIDLFAEKRNPLALCHPDVINIRNDDLMHNTNNLETLKEYIMNPADPIKAAEHLHIHRNTMLYRINKMKEKYGLNLSDGETLFQLMFSFKVLEFMKTAGPIP